VRLSCGDLVLVSEFAEDLFPADQVLTGVDQYWRLGQEVRPGQIQ
jgi:hypothetical protein